MQRASAATKSSSCACWKGGRHGGLGGKGEGRREGGEEGSTVCGEKIPEGTVALRLWKGTHAAHGTPWTACFYLGGGTPEFQFL